MQTYINLFKQNNDHTRKMRKIRFRSSFNNARTKQNKKNPGYPFVDIV